MSTFKATDGTQFTERDFNTLDEIPNGIVFENLNLTLNTEVKRLPKNLHVKNSLDLTGSAIEELGEGLNVGLKLHAQETSIVEVPAHSYIGNLSLHRTQIEKFGLDTEVKFLETSRAVEFNDLVCNYLRITDEQSEVAKPLEFSLAEFYPLHVDIEVFKAKISDITTKELKIIIRKSRGFVHLEDAKSHMVMVAAHPDIPYNIYQYGVMLDRLECRHATVSGINLELMRVSLNNTEIADLNFKPHKSPLTCTDLVNHGNVRVSDDGYLINLPENTVIYGDLKVPEGLILPKNLCCLGSITYY